MKHYRDKKKATEYNNKLTAASSVRENGGKKAARKVRKRVHSKQKREHEMQMRDKKKAAILRTQTWRLRVKLTDSNHPEKTTDDKGHGKAFTSYAVERRAVKKGETKFDNSQKASRANLLKYGQQVAVPESVSLLIRT